MKTFAIPLASLIALMLGPVPQALAQASCSSDGTPQPVAIFERFISADCEACWADAATPGPSAGSGAVVVDWIVPAASGDEAPLSAAATNDALTRLQALGRAMPLTTDVYIAPVSTSTSTSTPTRSGATASQNHGRLRVAHGLPFNDYIGTSIAWSTAGHTKAQNTQQTMPGTKVGALRYHLLLVESVPAGKDGTTVPRQIVRNVLEGEWSASDARPQGKNRTQWMEARSMRTPEGAQAERLRMVGWVDDAQGQVVAAAQSACR